MTNEQTQLQRVAEATNGVVTPSNVIDAAAFGAAIKYAPELNTPKGIAWVAASYAADVIDGKIARMTGTTSELGAAVDAVGDKIKTAYVAYHIAKLDLVPRPLLGAVLFQNVANAGAKAYDAIRNDESKLTVSQAGKYGAFSNNLGAGLHVIATELDKTNPNRARQARLAGDVVAWGGLAIFGMKATVGYWKEATGR